MRFMLLMYPGPQANEGAMPSADKIEAMMKFNEKMAQAGIILALDGLQPISKGARVNFKGGKATVTDGPFVETKDLVGGYWMIDVKSKEEALEWARGCPAGDDEMIEVRQVFEMADFGPDIEAQEAERVKTIEASIANKA